MHQNELKIFFIFCLRNSCRINEYCQQISVKKNLKTATRYELNYDPLITSQLKFKLTEIPHKTTKNDVNEK